MQVVPLQRQRKQIVVHNGRKITTQRQKLSKVALTVSIPGLERLNNPNYGKYSKLVWFLILLTCIIACGYLTTNRIRLYFNYPTVIQAIPEKRKNMTFPSISVCFFTMLPFLNLISTEIDLACLKENKTCNDPVNTNYEQFNLNLTQLWKKAQPKKEDIEILNNESHWFEIAEVHGLYGECAVITHTVTISYLSAFTYFSFHIAQKTFTEYMASKYILIPHGKSMDRLHLTDLYMYEAFIIDFGERIIIKLVENEFRLLNVSGNECYDSVEERKRVHECTLTFLNARLCRYETSVFTRSSS